MLADIAIFIGVTTVVVYASKELYNNDNKFSDDVQLFNSKTALSFVGLATYTFEGIGVILPVMETTSRPDLYPYILGGMMGSLTIFYLFLGNF
jgi:proton-coupled amino acid transporter